MLRQIASASFVLLLSLLIGCDTEGPADDDDVTPPVVDDDDDDDDDSTPEEGDPAMTFDPSDVDAGAIVDVGIELDFFELGQNSAACCADEHVRFFGVVNQNPLVLRFFFGLRGAGTSPWGIDNGGTQVIDNFEIAPLVDVPELAEGLGVGTAALDAAGDFDVFHFEVEEANRFVVLGASAFDGEDLHPWLWALADDGYTGLGFAGFETAEGDYEDPVLAFYSEDPLPYFLRVADNGAATGTFSIDMGTVDAGDEIVTDEVEPNDETADWQDLGLLSTGRHVIGGVAATAGHDADTNDLNGDLDVFRFMLDDDAIVGLTLEFAAEGEDFDLVLYDDSDEDTVLGFGSDQAINLDMATTANPEQTTVRLEPAVPYVIGIGNWDGSAGSEWTLHLDVMPARVPPPPAGDDDDSAGDDDDSATDDDDSATDDDDSAR